MSVCEDSKTSQKKKTHRLQIVAAGKKNHVRLHQTVCLKMWVFYNLQVMRESPDKLAPPEQPARRICCSCADMHGIDTEDEDLTGARVRPSGPQLSHLDIEVVHVPL